MGETTWQDSQITHLPGAARSLTKDATYHLKEQGGDSEFKGRKDNIH